MRYGAADSCWSTSVSCEVVRTFQVENHFSVQFINPNVFRPIVIRFRYNVTSLMPTEESVVLLEFSVGN